MERSRTYYEVVIESCDRKTNEFCGDREVQKTFDDRYYAQEFFDRFDIAEWYNLYVYEAEQKQYYTVLSLEEVTVTYDEDGDEDYREFFRIYPAETSLSRGYHGGSRVLDDRNRKRRDYTQSYKQ